MNTNKRRKMYLCSSPFIGGLIKSQNETLLNDLSLAVYFNFFFF